jgi:phosphoserine phosphatase
MGDPLPSWNAGAAKTAILDFIDRVAHEGGGDYVAPADRIAVFDNDGTLWCERPAYAQALFLLERLQEQAAHDPELAAQPVVQALLAGGLEAAVQHGPEAVADVVVNTHAGLTAEEFAATAAQWLAESKHPRFGVHLGELTYVPMLELLKLLRSRDFRVFVVTGGGVEFTRAVSEELYGVPADDVVGSAVQVSSSAATGASSSSVSRRCWARRTRGHRSRSTSRATSAADRSSPLATAPATARCWDTRTPDKRPRSVL